MILAAYNFLINQEDRFATVISDYSSERKPISKNNYKNGIISAEILFDFMKSWPLSRIKESLIELRGMGLVEDPKFSCDRFPP